MKKINIISPVYNEEEIIEDFTNQLFSELEKLSGLYLFEVIFVLDKSTDRSYEILKGLCHRYPALKILVLSRRFGHQMSLVAGIDHCDGDAVIMLDSDLEHPPNIIQQLLAKYEEGYDVVQTSRVYNESVSFLKKKSSLIYYKVLSSLCEVKLHDNSADFRLISKRVASILQNEIREKNLFIRGMIPWIGFKQAQIEFLSGKRQKGRSKYDFKKLFVFAITGIVSFSKLPLRLSILIGVVVSLFAVIYGFIAIAVFFLNSEIPKGWTSIIATIAFLGGIQLIVLGIIGEYIGRIFDEVKKRPSYFVEEFLTAKKND